VIERIAAVSLPARDVSLFDINVFTVCGAKWNHGAELRVLDHTGKITMTAQLEAG
jgi:hypothetical protein